MKAATQPCEFDAMHRLLEPFARSLTPASARKIAEFRADRETQKRIAELAAKCNGGDLSPHETAEYEAYVRAIGMISILQANAKAVLAQTQRKR